MDCLKVYLTFPFLSPLPPFPIFLVFFPSCLISLSNPLCFCKSFLSQKLPETSEDGGQQEGKGPEWVVCTRLCVCICGSEGMSVLMLMYGCVYVVNASFWFRLYICAVFNVNMRTCHCLTIIHGVIWIIFRDYRCFRHLAKRMKTKPLGVLVWCTTSDVFSFWMIRLPLINKSYRVKLILSFRASRPKTEKSSNM